jgi:Replication initiator protein A
MAYGSRQLNPKNQYEEAIKGFFKQYLIPVSRPEYKEILDEGMKISKLGLTGLHFENEFENKVQQIAQKIKNEKQEEINKKKAKERSLQIASEPSIAPVRLNNSRMLMAYPWFSPDQKERREAFEYISPDGATTLTVIPSVLTGAAKVWDGDILMYALSKAVEAYLQTNEFPRRVRFSSYEYLKQAGKRTASGKNVADLRLKLERLTLTQYKTTLIDPISGKEKGGHIFKLCSYRWVNNKSGQLEGIEITFSDELFTYFASKNDLLSLKKDLLLDAWQEDRSGLRKRLLMLVGTHLGNQHYWKVGIKNLKAMCGYDRELKYFKRDFQKLISSLPWTIHTEKNKKQEDIVTFLAKE